MNKTTYSANFAAFFLLLTVILFFNLSGRTLENHDYLRYAEVAREMIRSGDWLVLRYNGAIYIHKPPLAIWLIALPAVLKGCVTPFIARLPSAMFALLGGIIVFFWHTRYGKTCVPLLYQQGCLSPRIFISGRAESPVLT